MSVPGEQIGNSKCSWILFFFNFLAPPPLFFLSFTFFFFFGQWGIQGHCQKHIPHNQTSDGDSFPTACVSENSEIIPMFPGESPGVLAGARPTLALVPLLFVPGFCSVFSAGRHSASIQHCMSLHIWFIRSKCVHVPRKCSLSLCVLHVTEKIKI